MTNRQTDRETRDLSRGRPLVVWRIDTELPVPEPGCARFTRRHPTIVAATSDNCVRHDAFLADRTRRECPNPYMSTPPLRPAITNMFYSEMSSGLPSHSS